MWRRELADDWHWARALLRPANRLAERYPKPEGTASASAYRIVWRDEERDRYLGSCPDGTGTVKLTARDLAVYELDRDALAARIAAALGLVCDRSAVEGVPRVERVGTWDTMTTDESWVYLALQVTPDELSDALARLAAHDGRPFCLVTATRASWRPWPSGVTKSARVAALDEAFIVKTGGAWTATGALRPAGQTVVPLAGAAARRRPTSDHVPDRNEMVVLRVLADAAALMVQEEIATATRDYGRKLSRTTVGRAINSLADRGFVAFPPGSRHGVKLTDAGRALVPDAPGAAQ